VLAKFEIPNLYFYQSLSALALLQFSGQAGKREWLRIAKSGLRKLNYYAKYAPENYLHKCLLIQSQMAMIKGDFNDARLLFDRSLSESNKQRFIHEEALAYELAGIAYHEKGFLDLASYYLNNALKLYLEWGAQAKADQLLMRFPKYFTLVSSSTTREDKVTQQTSVSTLATDSLDVNTLLKASTSISSEVELPQLLTKLMKVVIESAGAQKGILVLHENNELWLEAVYDIHKDQPELLQHAKLQEHAKVPVSIIQYIHRTRKTVESHSFETLNEFTKDPYLLEHQPESILGLPIVNQGKLVGVIYLENQLTRNVFTQERVTLLSMLASQIAVSINNALLYKNLEEKVAERTLELASEKQKSDALLFNILPKAVAEELKNTGKTPPKYYEAVTILFTDFEGFSNVAKYMSAHELVTTIDEYFMEFDRIINVNHLEKIKTIGDAYMCAGGLPIPNSTHAYDAIRAARSMIEVTEKINRKNQENGRPALQIRIGIHTGPVVAGVVGTDKFAYDIWGNAVNKANRLESNGVSGKINISEETYKIVSQTYPCTFRGKISAKNIGEINMYFVETGESS
jgi:class 3 adenylate cyclase